MPDGTKRSGVWEDGKKITWIDSDPNSNIDDNLSTRTYVSR